MKKFFSSLFNLIINMVVFFFILAIFLVILLFVFTKITNIEIGNPIEYVKSFITSEVSNVNIIGNYEIGASANDSDKNKKEDINISNTDTVSNSSLGNKQSNNFYYSQLNTTEKIIYDVLEDNINNLKNSKHTIDFSTKFNDLLHENNGQDTLNTAFQSALDAFTYDHPELFYIDITKITLLVTYSTIGPVTTYTVSIEPKDGKNYLSDNFNSEKAVNQAISKVESVKKSIIRSLSDNSEYYKAKKVHDILANSLEYDETDSGYNSHNIYGALIEKKVVCEGYAKAFKYILDSLDIECILVSGTATNSSNKTESHMWNYIKLDNKWYGVDVTWDDPIIIGGSSKNNVTHDYFAKGKYSFNETHNPDNRLSNKGKLFTIPSLSTNNYK